MRRLQYLLTTVATIALLTSCGGGAAKQCCLQYDIGTDGKTYCLNHSAAVGTWVKLDADESAWLERLSQFEKFFATIVHCRTLACITDGISGAAAPPGFKAEFDREHDPSERETALSDESRKVELILCGFRDAVYRTAVELGEER